MLRKRDIINKVKMASNLKVDYCFTLYRQRFTTCSSHLPSSANTSS